MSRDKRIASAVADYICNNLDKPLDIPALTEKYCVSKFTLERVFKKEYDLTVHRFIRHKRLEKAHMLLLNTDMPIKELSFRTGFKSVPTFTTVFREKFNITPAALRDED